MDVWESIAYRHNHQLLLHPNMCNIFKNKGAEKLNGFELKEAALALSQ